MVHMLADHKRASRSSIWNQVGRAWSKMVKKVKFKSPSTHANILASNFWWNSIVQALRKDSMKRGLLNYLQKGWVIVVDVASHEEEHKFISWEEMKRKFDFCLLWRILLMEG